MGEGMNNGILFVEDDEILNCHLCTCHRLPALEEHSKSVNGSITKIEKDIKSQGRKMEEGIEAQGKKIDALYKVNVGILCAITTASIMLAVNIMIKGGN